MGQVLSLDRNGGLQKNSSTQVQLNLSTASDILAMIGGQQYQSLSALLINTGGTGAGGLDTGALGATKLYYVHAVLNSGSLALVASLSQTVPTGFTLFAYTGLRFRTDGSSQIATVTDIDSVIAVYKDVTNGTSISGITLIPFITKDQDTHSAYNTSSGKFTVPVAGTYRVDATGTPASASAPPTTFYIYIYKNGVNMAQGRDVLPGMGYQQVHIDKTIDCIIGDIIDIRFTSSGTMPTMISDPTMNNLSIMLVKKA